MVPPSLKLVAGLLLGISLVLALGLLPQGSIATRAEPALIHWKMAIVPEEFPFAGADRLRQDLARRSGKPAQTFRVVEATRRTWSNGCLDLAQPDELCTEALVPGWRVVLSSGDRQWIYHTDRRGQIYRLTTSGSAAKDKETQ